MTLTRRTAWSGLLGTAATLTGCELVDSVDPAPASPSDEPEAAPDGDSDLVDAALEEVRAVRRLVAGVSADHPRLRRDLAELSRMHEAHGEALGSQNGFGREAPATRDADAALALLRRRHLAHQRRLADHAVAAQSGRLARLLASMSAAVAQQLAVLPKQVRR